jgi:hypothetical protein
VVGKAIYIALQLFNGVLDEAIKKLIKCYIFIFYSVFIHYFSFTKKWKHYINPDAKDVDLEYIMVDSTILRAHACAEEGEDVKTSQKKQGLGRSCGGFSTKIHTVCDALGNPLHFIMTSGQTHDGNQPTEL